jgi:hypothetical protein
MARGSHLPCPPQVCSAPRRELRKRVQVLRTQSRGDRAAGDGEDSWERHEWHCRSGRLGSERTWE